MIHNECQLKEGEDVSPIQLESQNKISFDTTLCVQFYTLMLVKEDGAKKYHTCTIDIVIQKHTSY